MCAKPLKKEPRQVETTGHSWDGDLTEYNKPLPRWWLNLFYATIVFALAYLVLFPGLGSFVGTQKWSSDRELAAEQQAANAKRDAALAPGARFAEIHDLDQVVAEVSLAPTDPLAELAPGDEIAIRVDGAPADARVARVARVRDAAQPDHDEPRVVVVSSPFALARPIAGLTGHARIYGAEHSLAYANLYLPLRRLVSVQLWSMWR